MSEIAFVVHDDPIRIEGCGTAGSSGDLECWIVVLSKGEDRVPLDEDSEFPILLAF